MKNKKKFPKGVAETIRNGIKTIRKHLDMSKKDFAISLNVHPSYISLIESGDRTPSIEILAKMRLLYNANLDFLVTGKGNPFVKVPGKVNSKDVFLSLTNDLDNYSYEMMLEIILYMKRFPIVRYAVFDFYEEFMSDKHKLISKFEDRTQKGNNEQEKK